MANSGASWLREAVKQEFIGKVSGSHGGELKAHVFWVVEPCSQGDDVGSRHLWNVCKMLLYYTSQQPVRQPLSCIHSVELLWSFMGHVLAV